LFDHDELTGVAEGRDLRVLTVHAFEADIAFCQLAKNDLRQRLDLKLIFRGQFDLVLVQSDLRLAPFKVESIGQLFPGGVHRVLDLHRVHLRNDVE
jgi:hypothetical protein